MKSFDSVTLRDFLSENSDFLTGARIQKIQQPTRREIIFSLRCKGVTKKLYINIDPQFYHVCFMSENNEKKRLIEIPKQPPMFCMLLRRYLENALIAKVVQPQFERILELYIETYNELSEKVYLCLAIELMGKHSNVVLYNYDTNIIIGCAHNVGAEKSREREVIGGLPYVYPPQKSDVWYVAEDSLSKGEGSVNERIDVYFANLIHNNKFKSLKENYFQKTSRKLKKCKNAIKDAQSKFVDIKDSDKFRLYGDLIMTNLYSNSDFSSEIKVFDYENNAEIKVPLDRTKTLKENANKFYKLYNKSKRTNEKLAEYYKDLNAEKDYLENLFYSIESADDIKALEEISSEFEQDKPQQKQRKVELKSVLGEGYTIWIGKNNKQNDYIVSKLARDNDMWFHTHNMAGSHVLLRTDNITDELIFKCAKLAKENSRGAESSKVGVIYTYAKYLKKPPKANLGYVTYSHEEEIIID